MQETLMEYRPRGLRAAAILLAVCEAVAGLALAAAAFLFFRRGLFPELAESIGMSVGGISTALGIAVTLTVGSGIFALSRLGWRWLPSFVSSPLLIIFGVLAEPRDMAQVKVASIAFFTLAALSWALGTVSYYDDLKG